MLGVAPPSASAGAFPPAGSPGPARGASRGPGPLGLLVRIDCELPLLKYLGLAFWVAWFGVAYDSAAWLSPTESTGSFVTSMFVTSTFAHVAALLVCALTYRRSSGVIRRPWFILAAAGIAAAGCVLIVLAGPRYLPSRTVFLTGSVLTGLGTAPLCLNAGLLLCALAPDRALRTILTCEIVACLVGYLVTGVPYEIKIALFVGLPLLSGACFVVGSAQGEAPTVEERGRLAPNRELWRLLAATFVLCVTARISEGFFTPGKTPDQLAVEGSVASFVTLVCLVVALVATAVAKAGPGFSRLFYLTAVVILLALLVCGLFPTGASLGVVVTSVAFQLFDVVMWFVCASVVAQSKVSALLLVSCVRITISLGVTLGAQVGAELANLVGDALLPAPVVFALVLVNLATLGIVFPESRVERLLLPIPDEDDPSIALAAAGQVKGADEATGVPGVLAAAGASSGASGPSQPAGSVPDPDPDPSLGSGEAIGASGPSTLAGEAAQTTADERHGRWKALCLQLADEAGLTDREKEVFVLLAKGRGSQSISDALTVSLYTTRAHTRNIYVKLDVHSRHELSERVARYVEEHQGE